MSSDSLAITELDIEVVRHWPVPTCSKHVEIFMGFVNYHRGFIKDFSKIATPLYAETGKHQFVWNKEQTEAFETPKKALVHPPVLALPNEKMIVSWTQILQTFRLEGSSFKFKKARKRLLRMQALSFHTYFCIDKGTEEVLCN